MLHQIIFCFEHDRKCFSFHTHFYTIKILYFSHINFFLLWKKKEKLLDKNNINKKRETYTRDLPPTVVVRKLMVRAWCDRVLFPHSNKVNRSRETPCVVVFRTCSSYINEYTCTYIHYIQKLNMLITKEFLNFFLS